VVFSELIDKKEKIIERKGTSYVQTWELKLR
jgi:hypothetical protein